MIYKYRPLPYRRRYPGGASLSGYIVPHVSPIPLLTLNKKYAFERNDLIYIGTFKYYMYDEDAPQYSYYELHDVIIHYKSRFYSKYNLRPNRYNKHCVTMGIKEPYHDLEEIIEKGKKARQNMEQRSLNMVLKRLVNEEFQW
jgi:hypothetical protein